MILRPLITTSWDDGHPLDLRVAELLTKYGLQGTFYVPRVCEYGVMAESQLQELSQGFEIGGHTMNHVVLAKATDVTARQEIADCKTWIEETTGQACVMFCPPTGKFAARHLDFVRESGFTGFRTVELLSTRPPKSCSGMKLMPTTVQTYTHSPAAYARNILKRAAIDNLLRFLLYACQRDWLSVTRALLLRVCRKGGVFHLWGHSWEIERTNQWQRLEEAFRMMADAAQHCVAMSNGAICANSEPLSVPNANPSLAPDLNKVELCLPRSTAK